MRAVAVVFAAAFVVVLVTFPLWAWFAAAIVLGGWFLAACLCRVSSIAGTISREQWERECGRRVTEEQVLEAERP